MQRSETVFLRASKKSTNKIEAEISMELKNLSADVENIQQSLKDVSALASEAVSTHVQSLSTMVGQLSNRLKTLSNVIKEQTDRSLSALQAQNQALQEFAESEAKEIKQTAEDMVKSVAKLLSKHISSHSTRVQRTIETMSNQNKVVMSDVAKMAAATQSSCIEASAATLRWGADSKTHLTGMIDSHEKTLYRASQGSARFSDLANTSLSTLASELRDMYTAAVHHHAMVVAEARTGTLPAYACCTVAVSINPALSSTDASRVACVGRVAALQPRRRWRKCCALTTACRWWPQPRRHPPSRAPSTNRRSNRARRWTPVRRRRKWPRT